MLLSQIGRDSQALIKEVKKKIFLALTWHDNMQKEVKWTWVSIAFASFVGSERYFWIGFNITEAILKEEKYSKRAMYWIDQQGIKLLQNTFGRFQLYCKIVLEIAIS